MERTPPLSQPLSLPIKNIWGFDWIVCGHKIYDLGSAVMIAALTWPSHETSGETWHSNSKEESSRNGTAATIGFQKILAAIMEWWHSRAGAGNWLGLGSRILCLRQKRAPDLIRPRGHTRNVPGSFISPSYHMWCLPKAEVHKSHAEGRPLSVAYSFLLLLIEGIVGFYSCDHLRQRSLVTEHVNFHFFQ